MSERWWWWRGNAVRGGELDALDRGCRSGDWCWGGCWSARRGGRVELLGTEEAGEGRERRGTLVPQLAHVTLFHASDQPVATLALRHQTHLEQVRISIDLRALLIVLARVGPDEEEVVGYSVR